MNKKLFDTVYGFAVGDALGVPYEFKQRGMFKCWGMIGGGTWNQPEGTWSDDTSMTLATCDSIKEWKHIDLEDMMQRFTRWATNGAYTANGEVFDIGGTTQNAIYKYTRGVPFNECGLRAENTQGNGSLMRILPLAFTKCNIKDVWDVSSLTHAHQNCKTACEILIQTATALIHNPKAFKQNPKTLMKEVLFFGIPRKFERLEYIDELKEEEIRSSGYVIDTLEAAIWCLVTSHSYTETVLKAVNLGGDTDTIAAISGGLAGLVYGYDAIPKDWINRLKNKDMIESCLF